MVLVAIYDPGGHTEEFTAHNGEEFLLVLSGRIEVTLAEQEPTRLRKGDSVYFDATTPHFIRNPGRVPAHLLAAITPPTW
jgi:mannose-6-phosphate isomerase-like protein (cupin superfamily)